MSNEQPPIEPPQDEPVIGASLPPAPDPVELEDGPVIGAGQPTLPPADSAAPPPPPAPAEEHAHEPEPEDYPPMYAQPYGGAPQRSPMFFVLLFLGVVLGGAFLFLLYSLLQDDNGSANGDSSVDAQIGVIIDVPSPDERISVGTDTEVRTRAQSNEPLTLFILFLNGQQVTEQPAIAGELSGEYGAALTVHFETRGTYELIVRAVSETGATQDSAPVVVVAVEPADEPPDFLVADVQARVNLRLGPDESYEVVGTLEPSDQVHIIGRSADDEWVFIDRQGGVWLKRTALRIVGSIAILPVLDPTPTPGPELTTEGTATGSPSPSASPNPDAPDFLPEDAVLAIINDQLTLVVTVKNISSSPYTGSLVIEVTGIPVENALKVFPVDLQPDGSVLLLFPLIGPVDPEGAEALVRVDPSNQIEESAEDNNETAFIVTAPVESPAVTLDVFFPPEKPDKIIVTIANSGGAILEPNARLSLALGGVTLESELLLDLDTDESMQVEVLRLNIDANPYTLTLLTGGTKIAELSFTNPSSTPTVEPVTETPTPEATETPTS